MLEGGKEEEEAKSVWVVAVGVVEVEEEDHRRALVGEVLYYILYILCLLTLRQMLRRVLAEDNAH